MKTAGQPHVAIACGGTGGHFFPGVAVARELVSRGARVTLWVSEKEIDQQAVATVPEFAHEKLPAVGFSLRHPLRFLLSLRQALKLVRKQYAADPPKAVLAMGGFTSAAPVWAAKLIGATTFLHESNAVPGRANRLLSRRVDGVFTGLKAARARFSHPTVILSGTPVRPIFRELDRNECCRRLGMNPDHPVVVVTGGSQGARGLNRLVTGALDSVQKVQWLHLCGAHDLDEVSASYQTKGVNATVQAFLEDMPSALGAADLVVSRAGASSLAELAAVGCPAILVPLPSAADDHQRANANAAVEAGGALMLEQESTTPETLAQTLNTLLDEPDQRAAMTDAMRALDWPQAAGTIAEHLLEGCEEGRVDTG